MGRFSTKRPISLRIIGHIFFWLAVSIFYTIYFGRIAGDYRESLLFVVSLLPITIATTYVLLYFLIPRFLLEKRYFLFVLYFCYVLVLSVDLELFVTFLTIILVVREPASASFNPASFQVSSLVVGMYLVVFVAMALNLLNRWYRMQTVNTHLEAAHLEAELKLLKAQVHPHFLFNTLNNLYALTLEQSELAPAVVLHLSEMLDYMLYRGNKPKVRLSDEIEHIRNYLALERLRYEDSVEITFHTSGIDDDLYIAPLLLIPFVENSFKHGASKEKGSAWVRINLEINGKEIKFSVRNSRNETTEDGSLRPSEGIGLQNVGKRLDLLYPRAHTLSIEKEEKVYSVILHLMLD